MAVVDAEAAAKVEVAQLEALRVDLTHKVAHDAGGVLERPDLLDRRAEVAVHPDQLHQRLLLDLLQEPAEVRVADAKLGRRHARRDVRVHL